MKMTNPHGKAAVFAICAAVLCFSISYGAEQKTFREEGQFEIYLAGKEIGREKFSLQGSGDSIRSNSSLNFRDPANSKQTVKLETELEMDGSFIPRSYQLRTEANGQKGAVRGSFAERQATFEYAAGGAAPGKSGLLVGERYTLLDTNVFHHFIFIARLFPFDGNEQERTIEVVIPQELRNALLQVRDLGIESAEVRGKKKDLHHLKVDSGAVQVDLWVDDQQLLQKIAFPLKRIEVVRN